MNLTTVNIGYNLGFIFPALAIIPTLNTVDYNNGVLTKLNAETWEHSIMAKKDVWQESDKKPKRKRKSVRLGKKKKKPLYLPLFCAQSCFGGLLPPILGSLILVMP